MASKRRRRLRKRKNTPKKSLDVNETVVEEEEEDHDGDALGASLSTDSRDSGQRNRIDSTESYDDEFDPQFSIDDEDDDELEMIPTSVDAAKKSLRATSSTHSSRSSQGSTGREDSWARIEQYINEHDADGNGISSKEIV